MSDNAIGLTLFLLKPDQVPAFEKKLLGPTANAIPINPPLDGVFVPIMSVGSEPSWVSAVETIIQGNIAMDMHSKSPSGLLVLRRHTRTFVVTFGHAWLRLEDPWLERDFGRRVALNAIPKDKVIEIKSEQVFAKWHLASERAPRASSVSEFGVEFDRDLVSVVEGEPTRQPSLAKTARGGTSLRLNLPIVELGTAIDDSFTLFSSDAYKKDWPDIDNINPIRDDVLIASLEKAMDNELASGKAASRLVMFTPSQRKDETIVADSYIFGRFTKSAPTSPYLLFGSWLSYLAKKKLAPSVKEAKASALHILDEDRNELKTCSVFDCFGYELGLGGRVYVLASGTWYEVVEDFVKRINVDIKAISQPSCSPPAWNPVEDEGEYNVRCGQSGEYLNCDAKKLFYGGGLSQFEFCDLVHPKTKTLLFAKIVSKSSSMSHLTEQVRRTAQLLFSVDGTYRKHLVSLFKKHHPKADVEWLKTRPRQGDWNLCMLSLGKPATMLPFFAKCGLVKLCKDLSEEGHAVSFIDI